LEKYTWLNSEQLHEIELLEISYVIKLIKSPYLEKKIKGLNEFVDFTTKFKQATFDSVMTKKTFKTIAAEEFYQRICKEKLLEFLLTESYHLELLKRSSSLFQFY
jgi:ubiquitin carboxyl-terminal hydrolase 9/24